MSPQASAPKARILLVDDHTDSLDLLTRILTKAGYAVDTADSFASACEKFAAHAFDLLITDMDLGDGDGNTLCQTLRQSHPALAAIAVTGHGSEVIDPAVFATHLCKPIQMTDLLNALTQALPPKP